MDSKKNVFEQIAERLKKEISLGIIASGEKLPSCREFALQLGVNPNTVQKAYSLLERDGYLEVIPQKGAYARLSPLSRATKKEEQVQSQDEKFMRQQVKEWKRLGYSKEQLIALISGVYGENEHD